MEEIGPPKKEFDNGFTGTTINPVKTKFIYTDPAEIPAALKPHYVESNGKWVLDVEGAVPKAQLDEFRDNNVALKAKIEAFGDLTPDRAKELIEKEKDFKAGNPKTKEEIEAAVQARVAEMKANHETALKAANDKAAKLQTDLESHVIDRALIEAGTELGLRPTATEDLTFRGRQSFRLDEHGRPVAKDKDGNTLYGPAGDPLTPKDFVATLTKAAPHLFDSSAGSGAGGSGNKNGGNAVNTNPWKTDTFNLTQQSVMLRENPDQARQMAAAAGVKI